MTSPPGRPQALTIKQAKAAYKARKGAKLSETEVKQLERARELDRRAWRIKEAEKRRTEAAKKRVEREQKEREEKAGVALGSQRRCDRFGFLASQMHLGAFLNPNTRAAVELKQREKQKCEACLDEGSDEEFGDGEVDDETLRSVLDGTTEFETPYHTAKLAQAQRDTLVGHAKHSERPGSYHSKNGSSLLMPSDLESLFDELGSSTQIARELDICEPPDGQKKHPSSAESFGFGEFDLTVEEFAEIERHHALRKKGAELMPPPAIFVKRATQALPMKLPVPSMPIQGGYTMNELEEYMEDDLVLTQLQPV